MVKAHGYATNRDVTEATGAMESCYFNLYTKVTHRDHYDWSPVKLEAGVPVASLVEL
jgi:hypothetical protein